MDALARYLTDHLAGARAALSLARRVASREEDTPLGHFMRRLVSEIDADRAALEQIADLLGLSPGRLAQALGWVGQHFARLRLNTGGAALARLEELELLAIGIEGKRALWHVLRQLAPVHPNLRGVDIDDLVRRAEEQRDELESWRLSAAVTAFPVPLDREPTPITAPQT